MSCVNPNNPEFKRMLEKIGNPILTEIEFDRRDGVRYLLKSVGILFSDKAVKLFDTLAKNKVTGDAFWKKIQGDLQIPSEQIDLMKGYNTLNREEILSSLLSDYSYIVEIKTALQSGNEEYPNNANINGLEFVRYNNTWETYVDEYNEWVAATEDEVRQIEMSFLSDVPTQYYSQLSAPGGTNYTENRIITPNISPVIKGHPKFAEENDIGWFRSDDKAINIGKSEYDGAGGLVRRSTATKTRRILEVQSDLFQKGRNTEQIVETPVSSGTKAALPMLIDELNSLKHGEIRPIKEEETYNKELIGTKVLMHEGQLVLRSYKSYKTDITQEDVKDRIVFVENKIKELEEKIKNEDKKIHENTFLQLLNKNNNWVTFFIKSIIQDSAKLGYEKVVFPAGETAAKIEGHETVAEEIRKIDKELEELEKAKNNPEEYKDTLGDPETGVYDAYYMIQGAWSTERGSVEDFIESINKRIEERINKKQQYKSQAIEKLRPIEGFYEVRVKNTLDKLYGKENIKRITDEYGNQWYQLDIVSEREKETIFLQKKFQEIKPIYSAVFFNVNNLLSKYRQIHSKLYSHHSTIEFRPANISGIPIGESRNIKIVGRLTTDKVDVLIVDNPLSKNKYPHITLSTAEGVSPSESNNEIEKNKDKIVKLDDSIEGVVGVFDGKKEITSIFDLSEVPTSRAANETIRVVEQAAEKMGISIKDLEEYAKETGIDTKSYNGVADLVRGVIAIAHGMKEYSLTEEFVHIATAILEQTNPELITALISKIGRFKIYNETLERYKHLKAYQLPNGKPNIRKIKKEAVDKLLAELIVYQSEGSTEFPELMKETERSTIMKWWDTILDYIRGIYRKTNIDIFQDVAKRITKEDVGTVEDIPTSARDVFYQIKNSFVDDFYNTITDIDSRLQLFPKTPTDERHYKFDGKRVLQTVTEKVEKTIKHMTRTPIQKEMDEQKRQWGDEGHLYIERELTLNFLDKDGYALKTPTNVEIQTPLNDTVKKALREFCENLVVSYPEGTRFAIERKVVNDKVKGMIASKLDFLAIEPRIRKDGTQGAFIDILDWKFMSIDKTREQDVPWYKQKSWVPQMAEYEKIARNYGAKPEDLRKRRMVPFLMNYDYTIAKDPKSGLTPKSIEIGNLDSTKETRLYLLPVALPTETSGNIVIDRFVQSLREYHAKLYQKIVPEEERLKKLDDLNFLSSAIRSLYFKLDFKPIASVGRTFLTRAKDSMDDFEKIDFDKISKNALNAKLGELISLMNSAEKFKKLDETYLSTFPRQNLTKEQEILLSELNNISKSTERMLEKINTLLSEYVIHLAIKKGVNLTVIDTPEGRKIQAEREIGSFVRTFEEASKLPAKLVNLAANLVMNTRSLVDIEYAKKMKEFEKLLLPLEQEARATGKKAFDMIGKVTPTSLHLIRKLDQNFWNSLVKARDEGDRKFLMANMDMVKYGDLVQELIDKGIKQLEQREFSADEEENLKKREIAIINLKDSLDIRRETFNGYNNYGFASLINQTIIEEGHLSKEYIEMSKSKAAFDMWNYFTSLNKFAKKIGYFDEHQGTSFFPLIEATTLQKFYQGKNLGYEIKDFFSDLVTVRINEENSFGKIDPETQQKRKIRPRYFRQTDKNIEQLSTDLNLVNGLWLKALLDYNASGELENVLQTIVAVEKAKGSLIIDENGNIMFEGSMPRINEKENKNASIIEALADDYLYHLKEDTNSIGNVRISEVTEKFKKDKEEKEKFELSLRKGMKNADTLVRVLGVGLKPLIGLANWAGTQMQAFITAGNMYKFTEFEKNNFNVTIGNLSLIQKAILHTVVPLNEDMSMEQRRKISKKLGLIDYLNTWSFTDVMMITNSFPERRLQFANALSIIENSMVIDGKIVNIRQYVKSQDRSRYKTLPFEQRRELESTYEERVAKLKESSSLDKVAKIINDELVIEGVDTEALAKFRTKIIEYQRNLNGQMNEGNKAGYRRDTILSSFMMFKTWIPKLVSARVSGLQKNVEIEEWQYGRARVFFKVWAELGMRNILEMREILQGTDKGLAILHDMLEAKKEEHFKKTGEVLEITEEEFYDVMRQELSRQLKELYLLFGLMAMVVAAKFMEPPEDTTPLEKNRYKYFARGINKIADEISFYYNPLSLEGITRGSILPALSLLARAAKIIESLGKEVSGYVIDDPDMIKDAHPLKYFLNVVPGAAQFQNEILPLIYPELAKEMGIRVTTQSRR